MLDDQISVLIRSFVNDLEALVRASALEAVGSALGVRSARTLPAPVRAGRPRGRAAAAKPATAGARGRGGRRAAAAASSPLDGRILEHVGRTPGSRVEEIAKALGVASPKVKARMASLLEAKKVKKTGATRGTKYFPA